MAIYVWKCAHCGQITEVKREVNKSDVGPTVCESCKHTTFTKVLTAPNFIGRKDKGYFNNARRKGKK